MSKDEDNNTRELDFSFPLQGRCRKPRLKGLTMLLDKGIGLRVTRDILEICSGYIDFWKFSFGSSALYNPATLRKKIELIKSFDLQVYPGGTFTEIAFIQGKLKPFLFWAKELGFTTIEVSDGTIELPARQRSAIIRMVRAMGLTVLTEIGKKEAGGAFDPTMMARQMNQDLEEGASKVILEARESGKDVTIFNTRGEIEEEKMKELLSLATAREKIIWEAPLKKQQVAFISLFGPNVNLGNIAPDDLLSLESLRTGMRADTFRLTLEQNTGRHARLFI